MEEEIKKADGLMRKGKSSLAVSVIKGALKEAPDDPYLHYLLGIARMKCGRFFLAREALEKANRLLPRHAENLRSLGWVKVMLGQISEGRNDLREAISLDLMNHLAYVDLAMSYFNYLEFEDGFEWLERAKALDPENPYVLQNYKIAKETEREASRYSKIQLEKIKKEKLTLKEQQKTHLYILERYHRGKTLTKDDEDEIREELQNFKKLNKNDLNEHDFFDDCPVCQAMKAAQGQGREPSPEELKEAFKKAKGKGAMVGGGWFEKPEK